MEAIRRGALGTGAIEPNAEGFSARAADMTQWEEWETIQPALDAKYLPYLASTDVLASEMRDDQKLQTARSKAYSEVEKLDAIVGKSLPLFEMFFPEAKKPPSTPAQNEIVEEAMDQLQKTQDAVMAYAATAIRHARGEQSLREKRYERFTIWSYALFSFGRAVGLLGKLFDPVADKEQQVEDGAQG
jgi:hypothetical protein